MWLWTSVAGTISMVAILIAILALRKEYKDLKTDGIVSNFKQYLRLSFEDEY